MSHIIIETRPRPEPREPRPDPDDYADRALGAELIITSNGWS